MTELEKQLASSQARRLAELLDEAELLPVDEAAGTSGGLRWQRRLTQAEARIINRYLAERFGIELDRVR
jgi:hypothetical protein